ncbi:tRNA synthetases class I-domain-containing protein [Xylariomycetidae sp. FL2044]|nr:tRNA synthetases class I-domain-containing protein [Xylariomycetidae sp. FL2044]
MPPTVCARCRALVAAARQRVLSRSPNNNGRRNFSSSSPRSGEEQQQQKHAVVFSGIQPTGVPHLGNYLGALRQWKTLQDKASEGDKLLFSIVDLHAITMPQDAPRLRLHKRQMLAALLAVGLDPEKCTLFYQSSVPQHTELMWILSCTASMGYLSRMTQWKTLGHDHDIVIANQKKRSCITQTKIQQHNKQSGLDDTARAKLKLGLLSYPVLQAADILIHRATHVPVGDDQRQHLEFARECVTNFNATYGGDLVVPQTITTPTPRIMSLQNPANKMSKSALNEKSRILITSTAQEIRNRIFGAVTDNQGAVTYDPVLRPGVANLLEIYAQCSFPLLHPLLASLPTSTSSPTPASPPPEVAAAAEPTSSSPSSSSSSYDPTTPSSSSPSSPSSPTEPPLSIELPSFTLPPFPTSTPTTPIPTPTPPHPPPQQHHLFSEILSPVEPVRPTPQDLADALRGVTLGDFKSRVAAAVQRELAGVRERYLDLLARDGGKYLDDVEAEGAARARQSAEETMREVRERVGLSR